MIGQNTSPYYQCGKMEILPQSSEVTSNNPQPVCLTYVVTLNTQLFTGLKLKLDGVGIMETCIWTDGV